MASVGMHLGTKEISDRGLFQVQQLNSDSRISSCSVVEARKQDNNRFRSLYNSVVTSELFFEWMIMMADLILTCTVCIPP